MSSLQCSIPEKNVKVFAACVQCLSKVGKELVLESSRGQRGGPTSLTLSTMNDAKTAFNVFTFFHAFFENISMSSAGLLAIKIPLRSLASVFKSVRTTERVTISLHQEGARHVIVFSSQCRGGLVKTHELHYEDTSVVHASFDRSAAQNRIVARTSIFMKALSLIYGAEEASLVLQADTGLRFRSHFQHVDHSTEFETLRTEVGIAANELELLSVGTEQDSEIAFGLREMKALLQFCDVVGVVNVAFLCNGAGSPFLFSTDESLAGMHTMGGNTTDNIASGSIQTFQAELVVATLEAEEIGQTDEASVAPRATSSTTSSSSSVASKRTRESSSRVSEERAGGEGEHDAGNNATIRHKYARADDAATDSLAASMTGLTESMELDGGSIVPSSSRRGERLRAS